MSYAIASDVAGRLGRALTADETALVTLLLDDVERMIVRRVIDLDAQIAADPPTIDQAMVVKVEAWAVVRFMKNPDGKYQEALQGEYSFTRDQSIASGTLYITDDEWDDLLPSTQTSSAFTIRPYSSPPDFSQPGFIEWFNA
jgi:hypothetical protein